MTIRSTTGTGGVSFIPRISKPILDEIDTVLARHYGFTAEELDFILNYDIKYRLGRDTGTRRNDTHRAQRLLTPVIQRVCASGWARRRCRNYPPSAIWICSRYPKPRFFVPPVALATPSSPPTTKPPSGATTVAASSAVFIRPVEKECLRILLRGSQPVIICPARSLENMRLPPDWKNPLADGRLLILSCFAGRNHRVTTSLAVRRNEFVAALADEVWFAHIAPGGKMQSLAHKIAARD